MKVTFVVIAALVFAAAVVAAHTQAPVSMPGPIGDSAGMVLSGAALLVAGSALRRAA